MSDLPAVLVLALWAVILPTQAEAAPPDCERDPIACEAAWAECEEGWAGCLLESRELISELEAQRAETASLREAVIEANRLTEREQDRKRAWRKATPIAAGAGIVVGLVLGVAVAL